MSKDRQGSEIMYKNPEKNNKLLRVKFTILGKKGWKMLPLRKDKKRHKKKSKNQIKKNLKESKTTLEVHNFNHTAIFLLIIVALTSAICLENTTHEYIFSFTDGDNTAPRK